MNVYKNNRKNLANQGYLKFSTEHTAPITIITTVNINKIKKSPSGEKGNTHK